MNLSSSGKFGQRVLCKFGEDEPIVSFAGDDRMETAEGPNPHNFLYLIQTEEASYAECIETIMLSRQHMARLQAQQQRC